MGERRKKLSKREFIFESQKDNMLIILEERHFYLMFSKG
jgi:hypothetical protein